MAFRTNFKPDIIAGNPPYANGSDIDFIFNTFEITNIALAMITPAKWQTCDSEQRINSEHSYGDFRQHIVPYMEKVIFYPDAAELFEIRNVDGITIYICDKTKITNRCIVINRCLHQKYFNTKSYRDIKERQTLVNIGNEILESLGTYESFKFNNIKNDKQFQVWTGSQINGGCGWGYSNRKDPCSLVNLDGALKCIGSSVIIDRNNNEVETRGASTCVFESDNREECESFISWIDTKLVRFLVAINIGKLNNILTNDYFRFVPIPFKGFTGQYTDNEMYQYYNIKEEHITIIENIILPR